MSAVAANVKVPICGKEVAVGVGIIVGIGVDVCWGVSVAMGIGVSVAVGVEVGVAVAGFGVDVGATGWLDVSITNCGGLPLSRLAKLRPALEVVPSARLRAPFPATSDVRSTDVQEFPP